MRSLWVLLVGLLAAGALHAEPVLVDVRDKATARTTTATVGDVATVSGGDPAIRAAVSRLDLVELQGRDRTAMLTRRGIEYRIRLAGIDPNAVTVIGADRTTVELARRAVTTDEVIVAVKRELTRALPAHLAGSAIELAAPLAVKLPEVAADEQVTITAKPRTGTVAAGRVQMDTVIASGGRTLLALAVHFEVASPIVQAAAPVRPTPASTAEVTIRPRQRVTMVVRVGALKVTAIGEAQSSGRLGQTITVQNVDSKKMVTGRVIGPETVEVEANGP